MTSMTLATIKAQLRDGKYAWPGGYPKYFIAADGEALSFEAVRENWKEVCAAHIGSPYDFSWRIVGCDINWEDAELYCAHKNIRIPSAYADE